MTATGLRNYILLHYDKLFRNTKCIKTECGKRRALLDARLFRRNYYGAEKTCIFSGVEMGRASALNIRSTIRLDSLFEFAAKPSARRFRERRKYYRVPFVRC